MQPNSVVSWGDGRDPDRAPPRRASTRCQRRRSRRRSTSTTSRAAHAQAGRLTEWLKLALDQPELLETLGRHSQSRRAGVRARGRRQGRAGACGVRRSAARRTRRPRGGRAARRGPAEERRVGGRRPCATAAACCSSPTSTRCCPSTAEPVATLILAELRTAVAHARRRVRRHLAAARRRRPTTAGTRSVRPRARAEPARRQPSASNCSRCCCATCRRMSSIWTKSPRAHRVSSSPIWRHWCGRPRCGRRRGPARTASRRR